MRIIIFLILISPSLYLGLRVFYFQDLIDPIKYIYTFTGALAISLLFFTTGISLISKFINIIKYRRMIGLFTFYYASLHMLNFVVIDSELDIVFVIEESLDKPFVYLGMISYLSLFFMASTSTKALYRRYVKYHKVIYLVLFLITIHFVMAQKSLSISQWIYLSFFISLGILKLKQRFKLIK